MRLKGWLLFTPSSIISIIVTNSLRQHFLFLFSKCIIDKFGIIIIIFPFLKVRLFNESPKVLVSNLNLQNSNDIELIALYQIQADKNSLRCSSLSETKVALTKSISHKIVKRIWNRSAGYGNDRGRCDNSLLVGKSAR